MSLWATTPCGWPGAACPENPFEPYFSQGPGFRFLLSASGLRRPSPQHKHYNAHQTHSGVGEHANHCMAKPPWHNKICLVTGASAGLGLALARQLAQQGATVLLNARTPGPLLEVAHQFTAAGHQAVALPADVTSQGDVEALAAKVHTEFGRLDLLCNCAGRSTRGEVLQTSVESFQELWDVNFLSVVRMTRAWRRC